MVKMIYATLNVFISSFRLRATLKVFQKWKRKIFRKCFPQLIHKVKCANLFIYFHFDSQTVIWLPVSSLTSAVSVLERMLLLDPECRVTATEALKLPYFTEFREPEEETEAQPYDHSLDNTDLPLAQWKRKDEEKELFDWLWLQRRREKFIKGWRVKGKEERQYELFYWSVSCCASFFRSHLHRDLDLPTGFARIQGNLTVRHKE